jgi:hypothetical protein
VNFKDFLAEEEIKVKYVTPAGRGHKTEEHHALTLYVNFVGDVTMSEDGKDQIVFHHSAIDDVIEALKKLKAKA